MKQDRPNTRYKRIYGKSIFQLAEELNCTVSNISYLHKKGLLENMEVNDSRVCANIDKRIPMLLVNIKSRCNNHRDIKYKYYGGKGIKNHLSVSNLIFLWNRDKAETMKQPSIDRINAELDYSLKNCRFIEMAENRIKRSYNGNVSHGEKHSQAIKKGLNKKNLNL